MTYITLKVKPPPSHYLAAKQNERQLLVLYFSAHPFFLLGLIIEGKEQKSQFQQFKHKRS